MDFAYSPHREAGGLAHLHSPTHPHGYRMELSSIQQLRRSLSRSPSKPSRFQLRNSDSPRSPISPLALARAFSPRQLSSSNINNSPSATVPESPLATPVNTTINKKRFTLRRSAPFRSSPRNRPASKSPRRALGDSSDQGNATPFTSARTAGEENTTIRKNLSEVFGVESEQKPIMPLDIDDQPIKFKFAQSRPDNAPGANCLVPPKSSPLKRSDGVMNLDCTRTGSPVAKRRSLHGASSFGADFNIFDISTTPRTPGEEPQRSQEVESVNTFCFSSPVANTPLRRSLSLRKTTLQRPMASCRPKPDSEFAFPGLAASKSRQRMSLDGSSGFGSPAAPSPFRRSVNLEPMRTSSYQPFIRGGGNPQPHPLSHAQTPSSSSPNVAYDSPAHVAPVPPTPGPVRPHVFSKSLPMGSSRPQVDEQSDGLFATPMAPWKMAKPDPRLFMSTGLVSKKNRNAEDTTEGGLGGYVMPGTPSKDYKRNSFPPVTASPTASRFSKMPPRPEFGQASTPFSVHKVSNSISFGSSVGSSANIFGNWSNNNSNSNSNNHQRRSSFASVDGDDTSTSPCGNRMMDSQSSVDDMPPTPTKNGDSAGRRKKDSLRRTAVRQRTSLGTDTFTDPNKDIATADHVSSSNDRAVTPVNGSSPHTPNEPSFLALDPGKLSISGHRRGSHSFNHSLNSNFSFPPATPTTPRDNASFFPVLPFAGMTQNDVDDSMVERFDSVTFFGNGEFSKVYRAESRGPRGSPSSSRVWAVKKTKKPYAGPADREKKMQEVRILQALRGHDHVLALEDSWEHNDHLYIQTEYCEEGDLKNFLYHAGFKGRLDDFRIWKILMELSSGVKHIHNNGFVHLDLKPANILIAFDGSLKIADFGMATTWPVARGVDGEGDRTYLAPEAFKGRFDKPNDVYQVGLIMFEIAGNVDLPENGESWQRLRNGDFREVPSLTWSSESSLNRDVNGEPIDDSEQATQSAEDINIFDCEEDPLKHITIPAVRRHTGGLVTPPDFMIHESNSSSIHQLTLGMMQQDPDQRPTIDQVYSSYGCQWVAGRARAGATVFEGVWGPADDVLNHDVMMADMMDTS